jgi:glycosyltransferase involved in cell wall biosynthesis
MILTRDRLVREVRQWRGMRARRLPAVRVGPTGTAPRPTVYYLCPESSTPAGGIRVIYRHVDTLNAAGIPAYVVHPHPGYRAGWFDSTTPTLGAAEVVASPEDVLVVPEFYGPSLGTVPEGPQIVIFNQNAYRTFDLIDRRTAEPGAPYAHLSRLAGLLVVSEDNAELMRHTFASTPVAVARPVIDPTLFHPVPEVAPRRLSYVAYRRPHEREHLLHTLAARGVLDGWEVVEIAGVAETETARIMRETAIFLSFSDLEGFGLPPAEAMASGCYVIGYDGLAGREFFDERDSVNVPNGDVLAFARAVEAAMARYESDPASLRSLGALASKRVLSRYSDEGLRADLLDFYRGLVPAPVA